MRTASSAAAYESEGASAPALSTVSWMRPLPTFHPIAASMVRMRTRHQARHRRMKSQKARQRLHRRMKSQKVRQRLHRMMKSQKVRQRSRARPKAAASTRDDATLRIVYHTAHLLHNWTFRSYAYCRGARVSVRYAAMRFNRWSCVLHTCANTLAAAS